MRISDWSSDVCSSDLQDRAAHEEQMGQEKRPADAQPVDDVSDAEKDKRLRAVVGGHQQPELRHGKVEVALDHRRHGKDRHDIQRAQNVGHSENAKASLPCVCRSEEHTSELQSLMRISYAVFCLKKKTKLYYTSLSHIV